MEEPDYNPVSQRQINLQIQPNNQQQPASENEQQQEDSGLFHGKKPQELNVLQSTQKYVEDNCCLKCLLFVVIILLVAAVFEEKNYLIKKQRTLNFFIDKIQKQKIKNELNIEKDRQKKQSGINIDQSKIKPFIFENPASQTTLKKQIDDHKKISQNQAKRYQQVEGIGIAKIVQATRWKHIKKQDFNIRSQLSNQQQSYFEYKYHVSQYQELPFCVVIPSYNNVRDNRHIYNIQTIVMQNYQNYRIVFIDDASTDDTGEEIQYFMKMQTKILPQRYRIVINEKNQGSSSNIKKAADKYCNSDEIMLIVDGDDELIGRQVLKLYNAVYQQSGAWIVYSNFFSDDGKLGYSRPYPLSVLEKNTFRDYPFSISHLRSAHSQLIRGIKSEDLFDNYGNFFTSASDVSIFLPCLQMAHKRVIYIPEITYLYNQKTGINNHQLNLIQQKRNEKLIRKKLSYSIMQKLLNVSSKINQKDQLRQEAENMEWYKDAMRVQNITQDLGKYVDLMAIHRGGE